MISLLDVSVLIPLVDADHVDHEAAHQWFSKARLQGWATCPITQNGVVRIIGNSSYPNHPGSLALSVSLVQALVHLSGHTFWPDDISLFDHNRMEADQLTTTAQITDCYLLALAVAHGAKFATFDRRIQVHAVPGGLEAIEILG